MRSKSVAVFGCDRPVSAPHRSRTPQRLALVGSLGPAVCLPTPSSSNDLWLCRSWPNDLWLCHIWAYRFVALSHLGLTICGSGTPGPNDLWLCRSWPNDFWLCHSCPNDLWLCHSCCRGLPRFATSARVQPWPTAANRSQKPPHVAASRAFSREPVRLMWLGQRWLCHGWPNDLWLCHSCCRGLPRFATSARVPPWPTAANCSQKPAHVAASRAFSREPLTEPQIVGPAVTEPQIVGSAVTEQ
jgi:hypothetical protein